MMGCKMPWWAGSETQPPDKDKIIADLRAEVASLKEERDVFEAQRDAWKARSERRVDDIRELVARHEKQVADLTQQLAAANGRADRDREWVCALEVRLIEIAGYHPAAMQAHAISSLCSRVSEKKWELLRESAALSDLPEADKEKS